MNPPCSIAQHCSIAALGSDTIVTLPLFSVSLSCINLQRIVAAPPATYKVAITRFDQRIRVGGMAELSGFNLACYPRRRQTLERVMRDLFPHSGDMSGATFWSGLRPMTPDGTPIIGATHHDNLWLNTGHGTLGWTMACGSAQILADLIARRSPAIRADDLAVGRYA